MNKWPGFLLTTIGLAIASVGTAQGALHSVDPGPYMAASGRFPVWYLDKEEEGVSLELCQSKAVSSRVNVAGSYMCLFEIEPGVYDDSVPMVFPNNWPGELFWFIAEASIPDAGNGYELEVYTAAVEAAFALESPADGDQQSFSRIRIRASIPQPGTYTITHPYGVETFEVTTTGRRAINMTRDIGIAPGDFRGALKGDVGPFLRSVNGPYTETDPETGTVDTFIGDPNIEERVTGSPFDTNFVQISGPAGTIRTELFSLSGKILAERESMPVEIERASYRRTAAGTQVEVFASSSQGAELCYRQTLDLVNATPPSPCLAGMTPDNNGAFFVHDPAAQSVPAFVVVTAADPTGVKKAASLSRPVTDVVKINKALYSEADRTLTIEAVSSDEVEVPDLAAAGFGRLSRDGVLQTLQIDDLPQPPASITVRSAAGGSDTEMVRVVTSAPPADEEENQPPVAQADSATTPEGVQVTIDVLANDRDPDEDVPLNVVDLTQPAAGQGSVAVSGGAVVYTPPTEVNTSPFVATFTYRAEDARGERSEPATVTVSVIEGDAPAPAPIAEDDSATLTTTGPLVIDVLANDSDPEGSALTIVGLTQPAAGQGTVTTNGATITYTPPATISSAFTALFTYQVSNAQGVLSEPATVSVQVSPPPAIAEDLTVTNASVTARGTRHLWSVSGRTSLPADNTLTVEVSTTFGPVVLGTAVPGSTGSWFLSTRTEGLTLSANPTVTVRSAFGTVITVPLNP